MSVRKDINEIYSQIKELEEKKEFIQNRCNHKKITNVDYMWRIGSTIKVDMCAHCDKVLEQLW